MYLICLDIGNTRLKVGIFHPEKEDTFLTFSGYDVHTFRQLNEDYSPSRFVLSSTAQLSLEIEEYLYSTEQYLKVEHQTSLPFVNLYATPNTLGIDRIALVASAIDLFPKQNCLVIDAGTCITLDFVNEKGEYLGGSIHPGIEMRLKAMHNFTGKLPLVESNWTDDLIGKNTKDGMTIGAVTGTIKEIEHFILEYKTIFSDIKILLTGGDSELFFYKLKNEIFAHPNLVLLGLKKIALYNAK